MRRSAETSGIMIHQNKDKEDFKLFRFRKKWSIYLVLFALMSCGQSNTTKNKTAESTASSASSSAGYVLTWSDEFNGSDNSAPDASKWNYDIGIGPDGDGWGNDELQYYTDSRDNSFIENGNLVIEARTDNIAGTSMNYTSARITTTGKFEQKYGKVEARIKVPEGSNMWPAFWMLGNDYTTPPDNWPQCGEIDIMEYWGYDPNVVAGTTHDPGGNQSYQDNGLSGEYTLSAPFWKEYHVFSIEWEPGMIHFFVDGVQYHCVISQTADASLCGFASPVRMPDSGKWVFDHPFFLLLNLAVDGSTGAQKNIGSFPKKMYVDYVRVYQKQ